MGSHKKLFNFLRPDAAAARPSSDDDDYDTSSSSPTSGYASATSSPPSRYSASPPVLAKSMWAHLPGVGTAEEVAVDSCTTGLLASLVKEDEHVYSVAAAGDVLYTGTDSETVRVWKDRREVAGLRCGSGLVKAIVVAADGRVFTGHQDGKVRVWRPDADDAVVHRRVGSLPKLADFLKSSVNPSNYVESPRRRNAVWLRHSDAISCLSLDNDAGFLYSASWDRTFKVWRLSDSRCLESVRAHDDAVNTITVAGFDDAVFTGSADGTVKAWRRETKDVDATRHVLQRVLRKGESAVTAVAVSRENRVLYAGSSDGAVSYWQWLRDAVRHGGVLKGHNMAVMCLAVAGSFVVSGSADRTLCIWRRVGTEHVRLAVLSGHTGPVKCVAMDMEEEEEKKAGSLGERQLVVYSGSLDGSVKVWRLQDAPKAAPPPSLPHVWKGRASPVQVWAPHQAAELERVEAA